MLKIASGRTAKLADRDVSAFRASIKPEVTIEPVIRSVLIESDPMVHWKLRHKRYIHREHLDEGSLKVSERIPAQGRPKELTRPPTQDERKLFEFSSPTYFGAPDLSLDGLIGLKWYQERESFC